MTQPFAIDRIDVELTASMERVERTPDPDTPFRILLLGDFTGRRSRRVNRAADAQHDPEPLEVDRDTLDELIKRLRPELRVDLPGVESRQLAIGFTGLEDFHPDRLFERLEVFRSLRALRRRLQDPKTYWAAAAEVRGSITDEGREPQGASTQDREGALSEGQALVRELLEGSGRRMPETSSVQDDEWNRFLQGIVGPHLVAREDPKQPELIAAVDRATTASMRAILHHPDFQALEAAWRAVDFLVRRLETGSDLHIWVVDVSKDDLRAAFAAGDDLGANRLARILIDDGVGTPGAVPWAVIAGNYTFDASAEDVAILSGMARLARAAGAPFLAAASPRLLGCESLDATPDPDDWRPLDDADAKRWDELRGSRDAGFLGLALPRFLLRMPYGKDGERL